MGFETRKELGILAQILILKQSLWDLKLEGYDMRNGDKNFEAVPMGFET